MPYVHVHVDTDEVLAEVCDEDLEDELARRRRRKNAGGDIGVEAWTPEGFADDLRTAFYARNASRFEAILCALDRCPAPIVQSEPIAVFRKKEAH
ncbi:hypothetical protein [Pseudoroseomonas cervicalis]|uniref:hypothetical protein n=1 Tax=Teichococcus cervicalis TaxID=204525 RepID=UPI00278B9B41|nr:hypothetical protein [Pseudoroseomonas cervicalis]MDQ1077973.1 hypothetical protein [Pseudoroseomonas cervicalis]